MEYFFQIDAGVLLWIQEHIRCEELTAFFKAVTGLGNTGWFWIVLSVLLLFFKKTRPAGIAALLALAIGALITNVALKNLVARIRPYEVVEGLERLIERQKDYSFPSGHTCASFAAAAVYYRMTPKKWGILALVLAGVIAFSRMYLGVHYPTDILGGLIIGLFAAWAGYQIEEKIQEKRGIS